MQLALTILFEHLAVCRSARLQPHRHPARDCGTLAEAGVGIFAVSTCDTD
jgi:hypothetical protein